MTKFDKILSILFSKLNLLTTFSDIYRTIVGQPLLNGESSLWFNDDQQISRLYSTIMVHNFRVNLTYRLA